MSGVAYIAIRDDSALGSGTQDDPYNGSTDILLDNLLRNANGSLTSITADMTLIFGPGVFRTKGWSVSLQNWTVKTGQKLIGSGINQTVLQLVGARPSGPDALKVAIVSSGYDILDGVEVSDMTLDVNLARQPKLPSGANALIVGSAISLKGSNIVVRRVRVVNWGTYTKTVDDGNKTGECFPIFVEGVMGNPGLNVVEECVVEHPAISPAREATMTNAHTFFGSLDVFSTVRNNYCNGDRVAGTPDLPVEVTGITYAGRIMTVTTRYPSRLQAQDDVVIEGANPADFNGRFTVNSISADEKTIIIGFPGTIMPWPTNRGISIRRYVPGPLPIKSIAFAAGQVTLETCEPHYRKVDEYVRISGVKTGASFDDNSYNGSYRIATIPNGTTLTYLPDSPPPAPDTTWGIWLDRWPSQAVKIAPFGLSWQPSGLNGLVTVTTRMAHYLAPGDYVLIANMGGDPRWNDYFKVESIVTTRQFRVLFIIEPGNPPPVVPTDPNAYSVAQLPQTFQAFSATAGYGGRVYANRVNDVYTGGPYHDLGPNPPLGEAEKDCSAWNNYYYFTYVGPFSNCADRLTGPAPKFDDRQHWNITHDNIIDIQPWPVGGWNESPPAGVAYWGKFNTANPWFPAFHTILARDNIIRFVDWNQGPMPANGYVQYGMDFSSTQNLVLDDNLVTLVMQSGVPALSYQDVASRYERNNRAQSGGLLSLGPRPHTTY